MRGTYTRGVLFVHSTPPALCPHIEWALGTALGQEVHLQWSDQGAAPGMVRCEFAWVGPSSSTEATVNVVTRLPRALTLFTPTNSAASMVKGSR